MFIIKTVRVAEIFRECDFTKKPKSTQCVDSKLIQLHLHNMQMIEEVKANGNENSVRIPDTLLCFPVNVAGKMGTPCSPIQVDRILNVVRFFISKPSLTSENLHVNIPEILWR